MMHILHLPRNTKIQHPNIPVQETIKHMVHGVIKQIELTSTSFTTVHWVGTRVGVGMMHHTRLDVLLFGVLIIILGISTMVLITIHIITHTDLVGGAATTGTTGGIKILIGIGGITTGTFIAMRLFTVG